MFLARVVALAVFLALLQCNGAEEGVCDIYLKGGTPCVAAHSMTRALYSSFNGSLYRLVKMPENVSADIGVRAPGGIADVAAHDAFCAESACAVQAIYDQSPWQNHLGLEGPAQRGHNINPLRNMQDRAVNFTDPRSKAALHGEPVYAAFFAGAPDGFNGKPFIGQGYSNRSARGTAQNDEPETIYAVMGGHDLPTGSGNCCFDYGNAETWNTSGAVCTDGTMEAVNVGFRATHGTVSVGADLENGIYGGGRLGDPIDFPIVTAMVKGNSGNHFAVKAGNAQVANSLQTLYDGPRPNPSYVPMKKQGAIILGIGGDNSPWAGGIFYEGVMTKGFSTDETDLAVMANIVAAGWSRQTVEFASQSTRTYLYV